MKDMKKRTLSLVLALVMTLALAVPPKGIAKDRGEEYNRVDPFFRRCAMTVHTPNYYTPFRCLAGACPHTCCAGWEVPIDPATARLYRTLDGPLGERLRSALTVDGTGEAAFRCHGGRCPFLNGDNLCDIHIHLGEAYTGEICRSHPRFSYDYGPLTEVGLCASCPEALRLILEGDMALTVIEDSRPGEDHPALLWDLLTARETAQGLLEVEEATLGERLQALLLFANEVQVLLDEGREADVPQLCAVYREGFPLLEGVDLPSRAEALDACLTLLGELDILTREWRELLARGREALAAGELPPPPHPNQGRRAAVYFLYRHWLRGVWDGDVLTWAAFAVLGVTVATLLAPLQEEGFPGALRLFCQELEHHQGNLNTFQDTLWERVDLSQLLALAGV